MYYETTQVLETTDEDGMQVKRNGMKKRTKYRVTIANRHIRRSLLLATAVDELPKFNKLS